MRKLVVQTRWERERSTRSKQRSVCPQHRWEHYRIRWPTYVHHLRKAVVSMKEFLRSTLLWLAVGILMSAALLVYIAFVL